MKINLYYCPLCEKTRLKHVKPTVWICEMCNIVVELSNFSYGSCEDKKDAMELIMKFMIVEVRDNDRM